LCIREKAMVIAPESAGHAKRMYALHSHFMTEWKPGEGLSSRRCFAVSDSRAAPALELCIAAHLRRFRRKIPRDNLSDLGLVCPHNREGGK